MVVDPAGTAYLVGWTASPDFPVVGSTLQPALAGAEDGFAAVLEVDGATLTLSTFMGGDADDRCHGVGLDEFTGVACIAGTVLDGFPATPGAMTETFQGGSGDVSVVCVEPIPCAVTATSTVLGTSCGGATLSLTPPVQGTFLTIALTGAPPNTPGTLTFSLSGTPPTQLEGMCDVWVDLSSVLTFTSFNTDANGDWSIVIAQPNDAARCGKQATLQAVIVDFAGGPLSFGQLSNGVEPR